MKKTAAYTDPNQSLIPSGGSLVADFVAAITNLSTAETAKYVAEQSEQATINTIAAASQGPFVMPQYIPPTEQESLVRSSLDAHIKKVQAEQFSSFTAGQIAQTEQTAKQLYIGKKVRVTIKDPAGQPIESYWLNSKTGEYTSAVVKARVIKGVIEDISLYKNMIILRPTIPSRVFLPGRKYFAIFVVNPSTLAPLVELAIT